MNVTSSSINATREARPLMNGWQVSTKQPFAVHRDELPAPHLQDTTRIGDRVGRPVDVAEERRVVHEPLDGISVNGLGGVAMSYGTSLPISELS